MLSASHSDAQFDGDVEMEEDGACEFDGAFFPYLCSSYFVLQLPLFLSLSQSSNFLFASSFNNFQIECVLFAKGTFGNGEIRGRWVRL